MKKGEIMDYKNYFLDLKKLVKFNSVQSSALPNAPFGQEVYNCLLCFLDIAKGFGFDTVNYDGYAGEVRFGQGEEFGILCHLDIVPVGSLSDWNTDPFTLVDNGEKLIGRGVLDDKGPALLILYALKELKDSGFVPNKKIRLILGCNEESGWGCIDHLKKLNVMPDFGFSPDADFPVIYAEKGILHVEFSFDQQGLVEIVGGKACNMVCDYVKFKTEKDFANYLDYDLKLTDTYLEGFGKTAHASTPYKGQNAIKKVLKFLSDNKIVSQEISKKLFDNSTSILNLQDETGNLTLSPNMICLKNGKLNILCDIRYPATLSCEQVLKELSKIGDYTVTGHQPSLFVDKNCSLVSTLTKIYNEVTNQNDTPIAIGGGTYARSMKNCVAFGPVILEEDACCHEPNEFITKKTLSLAYEIYKKAIKTLA